MSDRFFIFGCTDLSEFAIHGDDILRRPISGHWPDDVSGWRWECSVSHFERFRDVVFPDLILLAGTPQYAD